MIAQTRNQRHMKQLSWYSLMTSCVCSVRLGVCGASVVLVVTWHVTCCRLFLPSLLACDYDIAVAGVDPRVSLCELDSCLGDEKHLVGTLPTVGFPALSPEVLDQHEVAGLEMVKWTSGRGR